MTGATTAVSGAATTAAVLLALCFAWAAAAKLVAPGATAAAFQGLSLPLPGLLARLVPAAEAAVALLLLVRPALGGAAALAVLAAFSLLLVSRLCRGVSVDCGCFGQAGTSRVSAATLARNALLAGLGALALGAPLPAAPDLPTLVAVTTAAAAGAVGVALVGLRVRTGALWDNGVAGVAAGPP